MIHKKELRFSYDGVKFEAVVLYNDEEFGKFFYRKKSIFWNVKISNPEILNCGGEIFSVSDNISGRMILSKSNLKNRRYIYKEDKNYQEKNTINIYPKAIKKVIYAYFNKELIEKYKQKVKVFERAVDIKYGVSLKELDIEKTELKKLLKSGVIDSKEYQKSYKPIRLKKDGIRYKISSLKDSYRKRYFECCELKKRYRKV